MGFRHVQAKVLTKRTPRRYDCRVPRAKTSFHRTVMVRGAHHRGHKRKSRRPGVRRLFVFPGAEEARQSSASDDGDSNRSLALLRQATGGPGRLSSRTGMTERTRGAGAGAGAGSESGDGREQKSRRGQRPAVGSLSIPPADVPDESWAAEDGQGNRSLALLVARRMLRAARLEAPQRGTAGGTAARGASADSRYDCRASKSLIAARAEWPITHSAASAGGKCWSWLGRGHDEPSSTAIGKLGRPDRPPFREEFEDVEGGALALRGVGHGGQGTAPTVAGADAAFKSDG